MAEKIPMGIGRLGFQNTVFKRKFRFTFELEDICGGKKVPKHYVKVASRPNLSIEETEINFLNAKTWIPGKASWETMTVTYGGDRYKTFKPHNTEGAPVVETVINLNFKELEIITRERALEGY